MDVEAARRAGVPVCNNGRANAIAVCEHALMLMLAVSRRLVWQHGMVASGAGAATTSRNALYELYGRTLGLIGLGTSARSRASGRTLRARRAIL